MGGCYFRKNLFREDENNTNQLHEVHIFNKTKKHLLLNCVVDRVTPLLLMQAWTYFSEALRSSYSQMFFKLGVLKIFENFIRKYLRWSLFK